MASGKREQQPWETSLQGFVRECVGHCPDGLQERDRASQKTAQGNWKPTNELTEQQTARAPDLSIADDDQYEEHA